MQGRVRRISLEALENGPRTPSSISKESGVNLSHVSRALSELAEKGLAECMTPGLSKNRIYQITDQGKQVLKELSNVK